ncbi:MAG: hypoxanthine-guanine phosphoribosyltransferase [Gammaproteobacteria bacterium]
MSWRDDPVLTDSRVVFDARAIGEAVDVVGRSVSERCADRDPLVLSVLMGALPFTAALLRCLAFSLQIDYVQVARYRGKTHGGELTWLRKPALPLTGRQVLVVDDVLDDGGTLAEISRACIEGGAAEVLTAVLVEKQSPRRPAGQAADFTGLRAGDEYLFGFGMDYRERYRHLPDIRALAPGLEDRHG